MLDDNDLEAAVQDLIMDICEIMYRRGYQQVCIGHIMRLVGVTEERASAHDQEFFALDEEFRVMLDQREKKNKKSTSKKEKTTPRHTPDGVTLH
jgi:hypothetical protein